MKIKRLISACLLVISVCLLGFFTGTSSQAQDEEYYVTFSADNYQKKSSNKMTMPQDKDYYILEAIDLDATNKFRVESNSGVIYYNKNGNAMNVSISAASKYNIYFAKDYIYDEARVENTNLSKTDAHISYEYYLKPSYKAVVGTNEYELKFNQFNSSYDQYYLDEIKLNKGDVVLFKDSEGNSVGYSLMLSHILLVKLLHTAFYILLEKLVIVTFIYIMKMVPMVLVMITNTIHISVRLAYIM